MKRSIALVLCLLLCLSSFAGCTKKEDSDKKSSKKNTIVGTWELNMSMADLMEASGEDMDGLDNFKPKSKVSGITLKFTEDGEFTAKISTNKLIDSLQDFIDEYIDYLKDGGIYDLFESMGMSKEEADEQLAQSGMTIDSMIEMLEDQMDLTDLSDELTDSLSESMFNSDVKSTKDDNGNVTAEQVYKVEDGKLYAAVDEDSFDEDEAVNYKLSGDTLTITFDEAVLTFERAD